MNSHDCEQEQNLIVSGNENFHGVLKFPANNDYIKCSKKKMCDAYFVNIKRIECSSGRESLFNK